MRKKISYFVVYYKMLRIFLAAKPTFKQLLSFHAAYMAYAVIGILPLGIRFNTYFALLTYSRSQAVDRIYHSVTGQTVFN
jgi:hypothetical protein